MQQLQSGTILQGGKYRIERVLGQGGFGITYLATHMELQGRVAIKEFFTRDDCLREDNMSVSIPIPSKVPIVTSQLEKFKKEA
jgi:serine/threonine protein kinase